MDDMATLYMFHELLADDGLILFYVRSNGYAQSQHLISKYIADREVADKGMYKTLRVIQKGKHAPRAASVRQSRLSRRKIR